MHKFSGALKGYQTALYIASVVFKYVMFTVLSCPRSRKTGRLSIPSEVVEVPLGPLYSPMDGCSTVTSET